jgi:hypothetical protein
MTRSAMVPRSVIDRKPPHGDPCNGCGACCMATTCDLGRHLFETSGPCPALMRDGPHTYRCGVMTVADERMREAAAVVIFAGEGCDARFNGEPINEQFHRECAARDAERKSIIQAARAMWGIPD